MKALLLLAAVGTVAAFKFPDVELPMQPEEACDEYCRRFFGGLREKVEAELGEKFEEFVVEKVRRHFKQGPRFLAKINLGHGAYIHIKAGVTLPFAHPADGQHPHGLPRAHGHHMGSHHGRPGFSGHPFADMRKLAETAPKIFGIQRHVQKESPLEEFATLEEELN